MELFTVEAVAMSGSFVPVEAPAIAVRECGSAACNGVYLRSDELHNECAQWCKANSQFRIYWSGSDAGWTIGEEYGDDQAHYQCEVDYPLGIRMGRCRRWSQS